MGESPATYEHADHVAQLTKRVQRDHPLALAVAVAAAPRLGDAMRQTYTTRKQDALLAFVEVFEQLISTELTDVPNRDQVANEVITAALYVTSGIDWTATSVNVKSISPGHYRVFLTSGSSGRDVPVRTPAPAR